MMTIVGESKEKEERLIEGEGKGKQVEVVRVLQVLQGEGRQRGPRGLLKVSDLGLSLFLIF